MSVEAERSRNFTELEAAQGVLADILRARREVLERTELELAQNIGRLINLTGRPIGHVFVRQTESGEKKGTRVPCYSLSDSEREPRTYQHVVVASVENGHLAVREQNWGEDDYELLPIDQITELEWASPLVEPSRT